MTGALFRFEIDRIKTHASRAEIISSLREYGRLHQCQTFGMREYDGWKKRLVTSDTIRRQFGSWTKALYEAGFRTVREQCVKCGASPKKNSEVTLEVDHIIPVAEGGTKTRRIFKRSVGHAIRAKQMRRTECHLTRL